MEEKTEITAILDAGGKCLKLVANSWSQLGEAFFKQWLKVNKDKSLHEEKLRYDCSPYYWRNLRKDDNG